MKRLFAVALLYLGCLTLASAQPVTVVGPVTVGNCPQFSSNTVLKDSGSTCGGGGGGGAALTKTDDTNVTLTLGGSPSTALVNAASLTLGWAGTLAAARLNANVVQAIVNDTNVTGAISAQSLTLGWTGTLAAGRLNANVVQSVVNDTNVTGSISAQALTLGWTGQLSLARGGTSGSDQASAAAAILPTPTRAGDIIFWNGSSWQALAGNNSGTQFLSENSVGLPSWGVIAGSGTVTSITFNAGLASSPNPIVSTGTATIDGAYSGWALQNCTLAASVGSNLLTVALKDNAGSDPSATSPCNINYRSVTASTGSTTLVAQTAALSISTFATGATLGSANATAFRFWVVAFNNGGTNVLGLYNASTSTSCKSINESLVQSSTAISGSATAAQTYYTPNGTTVTSKAIRILGYVEYNSTGLVTAGTYATGPNFIQTFGDGVTKPCGVVQTVYVTNGTEFDTTSSTFQTTNLSQAITPTSAANLIQFGTTGGNIRQAGVSVAALTQMFRGSTAVGPIISMLGQNLMPGGGLIGMDAPNTTSSTTYAVKLKSSDNASQANFNYTVGAFVGTVSSMLLQEIMG